MYCARLIVFVVALSVATATLAGIAPQPLPQHITASELIPLASSQKEFKIINGKDQGRLVPLTFQADPSDKNRWSLSFGDYGRISLRSSAGALIMDRLDLFKSKSYVIYEPALRVLPADVDSAGAVVPQTGTKCIASRPAASNAPAA